MEKQEVRRFRHLCQFFFLRIDIPACLINGGEGGIRPLCRRHHVGSGVGSPTLAAAGIPARFSDIQSALTPLRIPRDPCKQKLNGGEGGIRTLGTGLPRTLA